MESSGLDELDRIGQDLLSRLEQQSRLRDRALNDGRQIIRLSANSIRATHRHELDSAESLLAEARTLLMGLLRDIEGAPGIRWAGYVQDPMKEYAEASITLALVAGRPIPGPDDLAIEDAPYLNALAESASELRRQVLDAVRRDDFEQGEVLLGRMDEIYSFLVTVDFPDGLTGGLRRTTDALRAVLERTRGDLTITGAQHRLLLAMGQSPTAGEPFDSVD